MIMPPEAARRVDESVWTETEDREMRDIALASAVSRKWPPRTEHDPGCTGDHPLTSYNGLVEYPCPH